MAPCASVAAAQMTTHPAQLQQQPDACQVAALFRVNLVAAAAQSVQAKTALAAFQSSSAPCPAFASGCSPCCLLCRKLGGFGIDFFMVSKPPFGLLSEFLNINEWLA